MRLKELLKLIIINFLVFLSILLIFEIGLRLFWNFSALKGECYKKSQDSVLRYELKPGAKVGYVSINSDGFRDREFSTLRPKNSYRIIVLGDSETFSKALPLEDTMPKKLERFLNLKCPGKNYEVLNMGVEGYNSIQELELLKSKALKYEPNLIIVYYCFNDPDYPEYYFKKTFFNSNFALVKYVQYRIKKSLVKKDRLLKGIKSEEENYRYLYSGESWAYTKEALLDMAGLARKEGIKFLLVIVPEMSSAVLNFRDGYPYIYINERLSQLKNFGIEIIDPIYFLKERNANPKDLVVSNGDRHKNAKGNSLIASYLFDKLVEKKIISCN